MKAICVDDEPLLLRSMKKKVMKAESIEDVVDFEYGEDAIEWSKQHEIDIAFLDINLRTMTGFELAEQLIQLHPDISVVFCTGYYEFKEEVLQSNAIGFLEKPVMARDVIDLIEKAKTLKK